jgi:glycosyltransferase involved in cell wall biosynthesis
MSQPSGSGPYTSTGAPLSLAVVLSGWPRISETFALNELRALRAAGVLAAVFATKGGDRSVAQPGWDEIDQLVTIVDDGDAQAQGAQVAAALHGRRVDAVHGYFAHQPAAVAEAAAGRLGVPFGFSVHALDARKVDPGELGRRCRAAALVVCCNDETALVLSAAGGEPVLVRHGVDTDVFAPAGVDDARPDDARLDGAGPDGAGPADVLAVGRLVGKKGFDVLLDAMASVPASVAQATIIGHGVLGQHLAARIADEQLTDRVQLRGPLTHSSLPARLRQADLVAVPSVIDANGDRDGLPNVVLEAMASGAAVIASDVASIATAIDGRSTGVLVPPGDAPALARAIVRLAADRSARLRLGAAARARIEAQFSLPTCTTRFLDVLSDHYAPGPVAATAGPAAERRSFDG